MVFVFPFLRPQNLAALSPRPQFAIGSTWGILGDGLVATSGGVGSGLPNYGHQFGLRISPRLQPVAVPILGRSGSKISTDDATNKAWTDPYAVDVMIAQRPNVFIFGSCGANDNILTVNPVGNALFDDWKDAVTRAYNGFSAYAASTDLLIVMGIFASLKSGESTWRTTVWAAQEAHANSFGDSRVKFASVASMLPPNNFSIDASLYVHPDERGAWAAADILYDTLAPLVETGSIDSILDMIFAGTYPLMQGAQLDSDRNLEGTGGTLTSVTDGGGGIAASKLVQNTVTSAENATAAMQTVSGSKKKLVVSLSGSATAAGKIMIGDKNNFTVTASPGQYVRFGARFKAPAGFHNFGQEWGTWGIFGGGAGSINNNAMAGTGDAHALDAVFMGNEQPLYGNNTSFATRRNLALYWRNTTALSGDIEFSDPFIYIISERSRVPAAYLGALVNSVGTVQLTTNYRMRPTGTISQAAGGTLRAEVGTWVPRGLLAADFIARRFYKGTSSDTAIGSGTLIATIAGTTWTNAFGAGVVTTGDKIHLEVDVLCPITGSTITARSLAADAITAT